jgi:hypothetical protein
MRKGARDWDAAERSEDAGVVEYSCCNVVLLWMLVVGVVSLVAVVLVPTIRKARQRLALPNIIIIMDICKIRFFVVVGIIMTNTAVE